MTFVERIRARRAIWYADFQRHDTINERKNDEHIEERIQALGQFGGHAGLQLSEPERQTNNLHSNVMIEKMELNKS